MTRYQPVLDRQFEAALKGLRARLGTLEQRTNAIGTNSDGTVTVSNLYVVNGPGQASIAPDSAVPVAATASPALEFTDGFGSSATNFLLYSAEEVSGAGTPFEFGAMRGPSSSADSAASLVEVHLNAGGTGTNAGHGQLRWESSALLNQNLLWDQWGVTLAQPYMGSLASAGSTVTGSAIQNDQPPWLGGLPKFFHPSGYSGTTNASGELTFNHGCSFTPQGMLVQANAAGVGFNLTLGVESNRFTSTQATFWVQNAATAAAYASSFLTFYALLWG